MPPLDISASRRKPSLQALQYLVHHIFLPPCLPQQDDFSTEHESTLLNVVIDSLDRYEQFVHEGKRELVKVARASLANLRTVHSARGGHINEAELQTLLDALLTRELTIPLHIHAQNAAVIVSKADDLIRFETFELSPTNEAVYSTSGRLRRTFPTSAVSVQADTYAQGGFTTTIAHTLAKMSEQSAPGTQPQVKKAGQMHDEDRDTTHPCMISDVFLGFLIAVGKPVEMVSTGKNTREEVLWKSAKYPWRRSPRWLLIRVMLDLTFSRSHADDEHPKRHYKEFMLFLLSHVLSLVQEHDLPSDLLFAMNAKIYRRIVKAHSFVQGSISAIVYDVMQMDEELLSKRWSAIQDRDARHLRPADLRRLHPAEDASTACTELETYLMRAKARQTTRVAVNFHPGQSLPRYLASTLPCLDDLSGDKCILNVVHAVEEWVSLYLHAWRATNREDGKTCTQLHRLIKSYHRHASPLYLNNPQAYSVMLLTIFELWIACDEVATRLHPLLKLYDCGVENAVMQSLVLPFKTQMARLADVERYLLQRKLSATMAWPLLFKETRRADCFGAKFFDASPEHKDLHENIIQWAKKQRREKLLELRAKQNDYSSLMEQYELGECESFEVTYIENGHTFTEKEHQPHRCGRCQLKSKAESMTIDVHEWPLSENTHEAKVTIFELKAPPGFTDWRDCVLYLTIDVLKADLESSYHPQTRYSLMPERHLPSSIHVDPDPIRLRRVGLLSDTKPHMVTHRKSKKLIDATESSVCVANGLRYRYHDSVLACFVSTLVHTDNIPKSCMYNLPARSKALQRFLYRPASAPSGPAANAVIASQYDCPEHISLDEYKVLAAMPGGYHLTWIALLVQLQAPSIDLQRVEAQLTIFQCIYQAGPSKNDEVLRSNHILTQDIEYANALVRALCSSLERVKENWESCQAVHTLISVATRLLSLTNAATIQRACLEFLNTARKITLGWVKLLREQATEAEGQHRVELVAKGVEVALICICSLNIDQEHLEQRLGSPGIASALLLCSINVQEGNSSFQASSNTYLEQLQFSGNQIIRRSFIPLRRAIVSDDSNALDDAITQSWSAYCPEGTWYIEPEGGGHWLFTRTRPVQGDYCATVHYNLLTGEILVDGLPLARPPLRYENHPTYQLLFGRSAVEVLPTTVPGMQFSVKTMHLGHVVHFGLGTGGQDSSLNTLMVHATKGGQEYDLVPKHIFYNKFPASFVEQYVHWYNVKDNSVEFRPRADLWNSSSSEIWKLEKGSDSRWRLMNGESSVLGLKNATAKLISALLRSLAGPESIICRYHSKCRDLEADIPSLELSFLHQHDHGSLESKEFPGMCVDADQTLGTFVGFDNKLILKHRLTSQRLILLLEGKLTYVKDGDHVRATIAGSPTRYHSYHVDEDIRRLIGKGTIQAELWSSYLHGITAHCMPDPLLLRTGTEQALSILDSAALRSFDRLSQENLDLLERIARLTPSRKYYPRNERAMQTVDWQPNLGFLAQHGQFRTSVQTIIAQAQKYLTFYPDLEVSIKLDSSDSSLLEREAIRDSTFRAPGFGAENFTTKADRQYVARDHGQSSGRSNAFALANMVHMETQTLQWSSTSDLASHLWSFCSLPATTLDVGKIEAFRFEYDACWFGTASRMTPDLWMKLHNLLTRLSHEVTKPQLMMWLASLCLAQDADLIALQTLAALFTNRKKHPLNIPTLEDVYTSEGKDVQRERLHKLIRAALRPFGDCPEARLQPRQYEARKTFKGRVNREWQTNQSSAIQELVNLLAARWPCRSPSRLVDFNSSHATYIEIEKASKLVDHMFNQWFDNKVFFEYLQNVENVFTGIGIQPFQIAQLCQPTSLRTGPQIMRFISPETLFQHPLLFSLRSTSTLQLISETVDDSGHRSAARDLLERLQMSNSNVSTYEHQYVEHLLISVSSAEHQRTSYRLATTGEALERILGDHLKSCREGMQQAYNTLLSNTRWPYSNYDALTEGEQSAQCLHWPRISPVYFLQQLQRNRWGRLTKPWQVAIVNYALALVALQRAGDMVHLCQLQRFDDLIGELRNPGHINWDPYEHPETLLLETESRIRIREVQERIAKEMRDPETGRNSIVQLNMGEGKSSVIVPMVAASLTDGEKLVRVIVAKPQSKQMFHMLKSKLGGMIGRRVYHMPFSRALRLDARLADNIHTLLEDCIRDGGVLLVQPEHILSLKLMALESHINGNQDLGRQILRTLDLIESTSRDIVDECDDILSVKYELIYTMGKQRPIELGSLRWTCIHQILALARKLAGDVDREVPGGVELVASGPGGFPRLRLLRQEAQQSLARMVAQHVCDTGLNAFPLARQSKAIRDMVSAYITESAPAQAAIDAIEKQYSGSFWSEQTRSLVLLLRGLLEGDLLSFAFAKKRWRVDYGLTFDRQPSTRLAVPYKAKDQPSPRSEFSHPDVVILLTTLSYYYSGLRDEDLFLAFQHLMLSDQAEMEYQAWLDGIPHVPAAYSTLGGINLKDRAHCTGTVFPLLRYATGPINYFLSVVVFPRELLEFPYKLSTSGWDIGDVTKHPTTGFSGTNDRRIVLPLTVEHVDLPEQMHTNASVLNLVLQPENTVTRLSTQVNTSLSETKWLLKSIIALSPPVQVILDVGAQILELTNKEVALEWLSISPSTAHAVVFFNDGDELFVLDRRGRSEPLQTSPFAEQLHLCLIYLDEAHTRGTDLKLPPMYRAAVTLGANLTKDRLVQACMRMRKLGKGQSVVFLVSDEIAGRIDHFVAESRDRAIEVSDVLLWTIQETILESKRHMPLWAVQGNLFDRRLDLWKGARSTGAIQMTQDYAEKFLEPEAQSLRERYRPSSKDAEPFQALAQAPNAVYHTRIVERLQDFGCSPSRSSCLEEEQERELSPEIEAERQVQKPVAVNPAAHILHPHLRTFVESGKVVERSAAYLPAFASLKRTSAATSFDPQQLDVENGLLVTADFARTIVTREKDTRLDAYQRPVQWILTTLHDGTRIIRNMVVISPFEAQELYPLVTKSREAALHVYAPRCNSSHPRLDLLDLVTISADRAERQIPTHLSVQLNLFAGQLYFANFEEYANVCKFLGLSHETTKQGWEIAVDGFVIQDGEGRRGGSSRLTQSPTNFLELLLTTIRRSGKLSSNSHMGRVLRGGLLLSSDFEKD